jgi:hypothetical protein
MIKVSDFIAIAYKNLTLKFVYLNMEFFKNFIKQSFNLT